jgi:hypothetical protein
MITGQSIAAPMASTGGIHWSMLGGALKQHALAHPSGSLLGVDCLSLSHFEESQQQLTMAVALGSAGEAAMLFTMQQHSGIVAASSSTMHRRPRSVGIEGMAHQPTIGRVQVQACVGGSRGFIR